MRKLPSTQHSGVELSRRDLLASAGVLAGAAAVSAQAPSAAPAAKPVVCLFSKPLGNHPVAELPGVLKDLGIDAVDLTCRPKGHILPERAADDLPRAVESFKAAGITVPMLTTDILDAGKGHAEIIVKTAAGLGIRYAKLGYYRYDNSGQIERTLNEVRPRLREVAALFKQYGLMAGYHNHSGNYVGAAMWDLWQLLKDLPVEGIGAYFDGGHATVEGGAGAWIIGLDRLLPRVAMLAVKDFVWVKDKAWRAQWGPLGAGMVRWPDIFTRLKRARFSGPISLHVEYGEHARSPGQPDDPETLAAIRRDLAYLRAQLAKAGLA